MLSYLWQVLMSHYIYIYIDNLSDNHELDQWWWFLLETRLTILLILALLFHTGSTGDHGNSWQNPMLKCWENHGKIIERNLVYFPAMFHYQRARKTTIFCQCSIDIPLTIHELFPSPFRSDISILFPYINILFPYINIPINGHLWSFQKPFSAVGCFAPCLWWHWHLRCAAQRRRCLEWGPLGTCLRLFETEATRL